MKLFLSLLLIITPTLDSLAEEVPEPTGVVRAVRSIMQIFEDGDAHKAYMIIVPPHLATGGGVVHGKHGDITGHELALQSKSVSVYGWSAVPELVNWVDHDDPAVRYIAAHALIEITGEKPVFRFHKDGKLEGAEEWVEGAKKAWLEWFERITLSGEKMKNESGKPNS